MLEGVVLAPAAGIDNDFASDRTVCIRRPFSMSEVEASGAKYAN
jgi:hypothetical protein